MNSFFNKSELDGTQSLIIRFEDGTIHHFTQKDREMKKDVFLSTHYKFLSDK